MEGHGKEKRIKRLVSSSISIQSWDHDATASFASVVALCGVYVGCCTLSAKDFSLSGYPPICDLRSCLSFLFLTFSNLLTNAMVNSLLVNRVFGSLLSLKTWLDDDLGKHLPNSHRVQASTMPASIQRA